MFNTLKEFFFNHFFKSFLINFLFFFFLIQLPNFDKNYSSKYHFDSFEFRVNQFHLPLTLHQIAKKSNFLTQTIVKSASLKIYAEHSTCTLSFAYSKILYRMVNFF